MSTGYYLKQIVAMWCRMQFQSFYCVPRAIVIAIRTYGDWCWLLNLKCEFSNLFDSNLFYVESQGQSCYHIVLRIGAR